MELGVVFPQTEIGNDRAVIRDYATGVEGAGYDFLVAFDHVLGANPDRPGGWAGPYTHRTPFHEVFVLFGFIAALTSRLELATEVLILPQRQTALVAKQAAEVDVLSGGRLRLGVGLGWNPIEYEALGQNFHDRGRRIEEQVEVLRRLWAEELVTHQGRWHSIPDAGLNPLPVRRSIPIWMGGTAEPALRRVARLADGWMINMPLGPEMEAALESMRGFLREQSRDPAAFGIAGRVSLSDGAEAVLAALRRWRELGATHASVTTMRAGLSGAAAHIEALLALKRAWDQG
ncbi:MAG: LLM class F420-dependent oxidoreductase [Chloroflexi bacterium]|nr:MAG: LLM class F420-dependent oxidoreductase [Chloroflexota bacterium]